MLGLAFAVAAQDPPPTHQQVFDTAIRPLIGEYCLTCHSTQKQKGDLDLEQFTSFAAVRQKPKIWQRVLEQVSEREMPPPEKPQPGQEQREQLSGWVKAVLGEIARVHAGDPGRVVLRRLSNAEYTYTLRDLTGVPSLDPAREFPVDGAAGEGFLNVGNALVMSPALLAKYLNAGKQVAEHAVLLPAGIRFAPGTTRRDWTEALLTEIRAFYRGFTDPGGGDVVDLQGIVLTTNEGGRLPLAKYLAATLELRDAAANSAAVAATATARGLSAKYLGTLLAALQSREPSLLLDPIRTSWRASQPTDANALASEIAAWQKSLWKFSSIGHIGKAGGPKAWLEPTSPLVTSQAVRLPVPAGKDGDPVTLYLVASDAGDGGEHDFVVWQRARFVAKGRPDLLLRDVRDVAHERLARREQVFATAGPCLAAAAEAEAAPFAMAPAELAQRHGVDPDVLGAWLEYLGIGPASHPTIDSHFTAVLQRPSTYEFIRGWGSPDTPLLLANSSDESVAVPGSMKPHSVAVHPSPTLRAAVGWSSPVAAALRVAAKIQHVHPDCGNGVTWALELRRGAQRRLLANGFAQGGAVEQPAPIDNLAVQPGDLVSLLVGARDGNHSCDLTAVDLSLTSAGEGGRAWDLASNCSPDVLAANPHADRFGNPGVWHFYTEPDLGDALTTAAIPQGSLLASWRSASGAAARMQYAAAVQQLLTSGPPGAADSPDGLLYRQLASLRGPLLAWRTSSLSARPSEAPGRGAYGLDPALFGKDHDGRAVAGSSLCVNAPSIVEIRVPAELVAGCEFVVDGALEPGAGAAGSVQLQVLTEKPANEPGLQPSDTTVSAGSGPWTSNNQRISHAVPVVVQADSAAARRFETAFDEFRQLFPAALCYGKIVPVDEVVTLTQFHREDRQLVRLMLDDAQARELDRLWDELHFVAQDALTQVDAFEQIYQFATQDADPKVFEPLREPIAQAAAAFRQRLVDAEPRHLEAILEFAGRAWRRPLADAEQAELRELYRQLRGKELPHDETIRLLLARVLLAPAFLYHRELPGPGSAAAPVTDWELASRLSYFLWSSAPDAELRAAAASGALHRDAELQAQAHRMLRDPRVRRLATEFGCVWLHVYAFDELGEKSERHFPTFQGLRGAMYEESIRFFTSLFQANAPALDLLDADYTFLNAELAEHYGIPGVVGPEWRRVDGVKQYSRGGILGLATTLAKHSGASRTSPILRGNWLCEVVLGDKLPRPPKDVPKLPEDEANETLTVRQLVEKHSSDPRCARCHDRMDAFGFSLEGFDTIGRRRQRDLGGRLVDTRVKKDGAEFDGLDGLRNYLLTQRREAFLGQFQRKLLGYALGRAVQLSDQPLLEAMLARAQTHPLHLDDLVTAIVSSRQFREIRGRDAIDKD